MLCLIHAVARNPASCEPGFPITQQLPNKSFFCQDDRHACGITIRLALTGMKSSFLKNLIRPIDAPRTKRMTAAKPQSIPHGTMQTHKL